MPGCLRAVEALALSLLRVQCSQWGAGTTGAEAVWDFPPHPVHHPCNSLTDPTGFCCQPSCVPQKAHFLLHCPRHPNQRRESLVWHAHPPHDKDIPLQGSVALWIHLIHLGPEWDLYWGTDLSVSAATLCNSMLNASLTCRWQVTYLQFWINRHKKLLFVLQAVFSTFNLASVKKGHTCNHKLLSFFGQKPKTKLKAFSLASRQTLFEDVIG